MRYLLLLCLLVCSIPVASGAVHISALLPNPEAGDTSKEWVELVNTSEEAVDISGYELDADSLPYYTFPQGTIVEAHSALRLLLRHDGTQEYMGTGGSFGSSNMRNAKGFVALFSDSSHASGSLLSYLVYGAGGQHHEELAISSLDWDSTQIYDAPSEGEILQVHVGTGTILQESGSGTVIIEGSGSGTTLSETSSSGIIMDETPPSEPPSTSSPSCIPRQEELVVISEVMPNPEGPDRGKEWVELYNPTSSLMHLCHLILDDEEGGSTPQILQFQTIPAFSFLVIEGAALSISLNNGSDTVRIIHDLTGHILDSVTYVDAPSGNSFSRLW